MVKNKGRDHERDDDEDEDDEDEVQVQRAKKGHNSGIEETDKVTKARLKGIIDRIERLEEEKTSLQEDIKEIYGEAKAFGFDTKTIRKIIKLRKVDIDKRREDEILLDTYMAALGMI